MEKTTDGINFKAIETLDGAGNYNGILNYSTEDNNPEIGKNYYRLKQTDFDGRFKYSELIAINNTIKNKNIVKRINQLGQEVDENATGLIIEFYSDGTSNKVIK